jgi:periplasmic protein TonB
MSTATIALPTRPRPSLGPALGRVPFPVGTILLSALVHMMAIAALVAGAIWHEPQPKPYIVNLVPAIAAVGRPDGRATVPAPTLPPRPSEITPAPTKTTPAELPQREARVSTLPPEMPARTSPRPSLALPDRSLPPPRPAALPRPGDKELPATASARSSGDAAPRREAAVPPPPTPLGQAAGSPQGAGTVTLSVSDFPYAWYLAAVTRKIQERWDGRAIEGRQPEIVFAIGKDGQLRRLEVGKSSGNPAYDQLAIRAIRDAAPFPNLPDGFDKPTLTIGLQFIYDARAR